ncbi:MAG: transposase, partial [Thermoproteota archaeon]
VFLYCVSDGRARKEGSIKEKFQSRFEEELSRLRASLGKKGGIKKYEKVIERIGRIKERYFSEFGSFDETKQNLLAFPAWV